MSKEKKYPGTKLEMLIRILDEAFEKAKIQVKGE